MSISSGLCVSCKADLFNGIHQPGDTYKIALYSDAAMISPITETYTPAGEVKGQGYTVGGVVLTGRQVKVTGLKATIGWSDEVLIRNASISARGGLVYNASKQNCALGVVDFGQNITSTNGNFKVVVDELFWVA